MATVSDGFRRFAVKSADILGSHWAFFSALAVVISWLVTGPLFHWSDSWQIFINTATTIITFLMVFIVQVTQNRDARAVHLKLDELIRVQKAARNKLADLEEASEAEVRELEEEFRTLGHHVEDGGTIRPLP
jgi:low affinity Fe/Cu permease